MGKEHVSRDEMDRWTVRIFLYLIWRNIHYACFLYCTVCLNNQILSVWTNNIPIYMNSVVNYG